MTALPSSGQFAMVDRDWVAAVGANAAILYARILWRSQLTGEWPATRDDLVRETGLSADMIRTAISVLRDHEWVSTRRASAQDATTVWTPICAGQTDSGNIPTSGGESPQMELGISPISSTETSKKEPPTPSGGVTDPPVLRAVPTTTEVDAEFDRFWSLYPRRVGKQAARKAYARARRKTPMQAIASGLVAQLPDLRTRPVKFVPYPATWINEGRWDDDPVAPDSGDLDEVPAYNPGVFG